MFAVQADSTVAPRMEHPCAQAPIQPLQGVEMCELSRAVSTAACTNVAICLQTKGRGSLLESASWLLFLLKQMKDLPL